MIFIPLHLAALAILMYLYARHEADISPPKIALIFILPIWILNVVSGYIGILALPVYFLYVMFALHQWFYVTWGKAAAIAGSFVAYMLVFSLIFFGLTLTPNEKKEIAEEMREEQGWEIDESDPASDSLPAGDESKPVVDRGLIGTEGSHQNLASAPDDKRGEVSATIRETRGSVRIWLLFGTRYDRGGFYRSTDQIDPDSDWFLYVEDNSNYWIYMGDSRLNHMVNLPGSKLEITSADEDPDLLSKAPELVRERLEGVELGGGLSEEEIAKIKLEKEEQKKRAEAAEKARIIAAKEELMKETQEEAERRMVETIGWHYNLVRITKQEKLSRGAIVVLVRERKGKLAYWLKVSRAGSQALLYSSVGPIDPASDWFVYLENNDVYWGYDGDQLLTRIERKRGTMKTVDSNENPDLLKEAPERVREKLKGVKLGGV